MDHAFVPKYNFMQYSEFKISNMTAKTVTKCHPQVCPDQWGYCPVMEHISLDQKNFELLEGPKIRKRSCRKQNRFTRTPVAHTCMS
jgi:hypothetical protein